MLPAASALASPEILGPGRIDVPLVADRQYDAGQVIIHNNNGGLLIKVETANGWKMNCLQVHAGWEENPVPTNEKGNPTPGEFGFTYEYPAPISRKTWKGSGGASLMKPSVCGTSRCTPVWCR